MAVILPVITASIKPGAMQRRGPRGNCHHTKRRTRPCPPRPSRPCGAARRRARRYPQNHVRGVELGFDHQGRLPPSDLRGGVGPAQPARSIRTPGTPSRLAHGCDGAVASFFAADEPRGARSPTFFRKQGRCFFQELVLRPQLPASPPPAWRSRPIRRRLRGPGPRRPSSCAWSTPDPHGLRNQVVGGGHGRDRALLLQDLANNLLLELIGVFGSGHELTPHLSREETLPKSRGPRSLQTVSARGPRLGRGGGCRGLADSSCASSPGCGVGGRDFSAVRVLG